MHPHLGEQLLDQPSFWLAVGLSGDLLWILAYVLTIRVGFKQKAFGIPVLAICLNFTWELIYTLLEPSPTPLKHWLNVSWLVADSFIVYQLFRYGKPLQTIPQMQKYFYPAVVGTMVLCFVGQVTFHHAFHDRAGFEDAYMINLVMSVLFVFFYFHRPDLRGLSYGAAWAKMLGTGVLSLGSFIESWGTPGYHGFMNFLYVSIFMFDLLYIYLLHQGRSPVQAPSLSHAA